MTRLAVSTAAALLCLTAACKGGDAPADGDGDGRKETTYVPIQVRSDRPDLVFSYVDEKGKFQSTSKIDSIPAASKGHVTVTDLSLSPEQRKSDEIIYVANLTSPKADGSFPYTVASRYGFELQAKALKAEKIDALANSGEAIVVYGTEWCGACKSAKRFLKKRGVEFIEKDVEKDPGAQQELVRKAQAARVPVQGVPVIDVYGRIMPGFDADTLGRLIDEKNKAL